MALSKRVRFEIFKRDSFTCQYCGRRPPEVVLHVDHIHPQSQGGTADDINLITSCDGCNLGKGAKLLGDAAVRPDADVKYLEVQQEIAEARRYLQAKEERGKYEGALVFEIKKMWDQHLYWTPPNEPQIKRWLSEYSPEEIDRCIIAMSEADRRRRIQFKTSAVDYLSGILFNRRREGQ